MQLTVSNLSKSYGVHTVLDSVGLTLGTGQRIGLVGANGVGKSTLLKCLIGEIEADSAAITLTRAARIGYLAQTMDGFGGATLGDVIEAAIAPIRALEQRLRQLEGEMALRPAALSTILDSYAECLEAYEWAGGHDLAYRIERVLSGLGVAHLPRQRLVETCSGGEKARVRLAMLLLGSPDMLLLDEPTNHLDALSLAWLERYLAASHSAMLIVSHDRHFLNQTVNAILEIDEHTHALKRYSGNYDAYLEAKRLERARWLEDYARQEEQIKELRHAIKVEARQVAHNRPPKDGDKLVYNGKKANVESTIARRVHN
ncbi:MAG TPA: ATP-binding cassette domain-containing protein, partial [Aggregatilineales bacterium]|nr:ATP-binding cassette domain-containing protein [Aggregatilineales bacterium]